MTDAHHFGHHRHTNLVAGGTKIFETFYAQTLKGMGAGARLESTATQNMGTGAFHQTGCRCDLLFAFDGAGAGHDHRSQSIPQNHVADPHLAGNRMKIPGNQLIRFTDMYNLKHARKFQNSAIIDIPLVTKDPDSSSLFTGNRLASKTEGDHSRLNGPNLFDCSVVMHYNKHGQPSSSVK